MTISSLESCFGNIFASHPELVISRSLFNLSKVASTLELIREIINPRERILVLYGDLIELTIINAHSKVTSFFFTNKTEAPHGEILGCIGASTLSVHPEPSNMEDLKYDSYPVTSQCPSQFFIREESWKVIRKKPLIFPYYRD